MPTELICPADSGKLNKQSDAYHCAICGKDIPIVEGVACFLPKPDDFYEGAYENAINFLPRSERPWHVWPLWLLNSGYVWAVRKYVPAGGRVVDLGCASGIAYFGKRFEMIGCDLSFASLKNIDSYQLRLQADAGRCLPLAAGSVDAVVSSYFWEHLAEETKCDILRECHRVLRPGGKLIFLYDISTDNPLIARYRKISPARYEELFKENDGHIGYQTSSENRRIFESMDYDMMAQKGMEKTVIQSPACYEKLAQFNDNRFLAFMAKLGNQPFVYPWTAFVRLIDSLAHKTLPRSWARIELVIAKKRRI